MSRQEQQVIRQWSVAGNDRIVGTVYNRPGQADGRTIMTSPVVQIRFVRADGRPVAFTESGSVYWLEEPSGKWGPGEAEAFIRLKSGAASAAARPAPRPDLTTMLMQPKALPAASAEEA